MNIIIETIQPQHKLGIHALLERLNQVDQLGFSLTNEWLDYIIQETSESIFIGLYGGRVIGIATCMINEMDKAHAVTNIVVHPHYRKQGVGTKLHNQIMGYAEHKNIKTMEAYVKQRLSSAVRFAKQRGFYPVLYAWEMALDIHKAEFQSPYPNHVDLIFRQASTDDSRVYADIINTTFGDALDRNVLGQLLQDHSISVYLLEREGEPIGSTTIQLKANLSLGYIYDVAILE